MRSARAFKAGSGYPSGFKRAPARADALRQLSTHQGVDMRRISLALIGAALLTVLAMSGSAAAQAAPKTCTTQSKNVIGKTVEGTLTSSNVNSIQKEFATCAHAKRVMQKVTLYRYEEPKSVAAFWCTPRVLKTTPDVVKYRCEFKGADTPMLVRLTFKVTYNLD
jgi:hypothetical protein